MEIYCFNNCLFDNIVCLNLIFLSQRQDSYGYLHTIATNNINDKATNLHHDTYFFRKIIQLESRLESNKTWWESNGNSIAKSRNTSVYGTHININDFPVTLLPLKANCLHPQLSYTLKIMMMIEIMVQIQQLRLK